MIIFPIKTKVEMTTQEELTSDHWLKAYRPVFFDWGALLYIPIQPARAQKCAPIKNEPSIEVCVVLLVGKTFF